MGISYINILAALAWIWKEKITQLSQFSTSLTQIDFFWICEFAKTIGVLLKTNDFKLRIPIFRLNSLPKFVKISLNIDLTSVGSEVFYFPWYDSKGHKHRRFQTELQQKEHQLEMLMIFNEEMTKRQDFSAPAATNKDMIIASNNRTNIFVKRKTNISNIFELTWILNRISTCKPRITNHRNKSLWW